MPGALPDAVRRARPQSALVRDDRRRLTLARPPGVAAAPVRCGVDQGKWNDTSWSGDFEHGGEWQKGNYLISDYMFCGYFDTKHQKYTPRPPSEM